MAVNVTLNIFDKTGENHLKRIYLYFGEALPGTWDGWKWAENQGLTIDGPWAYDEGNHQSIFSISKLQLSKWIEKGFLSADALGREQSASFLDAFPDDAIFYLNFMDWS